MEGIERSAPKFYFRSEILFFLFLMDFYFKMFLILCFFVLFNSSASDLHFHDIEGRSLLEGSQESIFPSRVLLSDYLSDSSLLAPIQRSHVQRSFEDAPVSFEDVLHSQNQQQNTADLSIVPQPSMSIAISGSPYETRLPRGNTEEYQRKLLTSRFEEKFNEEDYFRRKLKKESDFVNQIALAVRVNELWRENIDRKLSERNGESIPNCYTLKRDALKNGDPEIIEQLVLRLMISPFKRLKRTSVALETEAFERKILPSDRCIFDHSEEEKKEEKRKIIKKTHSRTRKTAQRLQQGVSSQESVSIQSSGSLKSDGVRKKKEKKPTNQSTTGKKS